MKTQCWIDLFDAPTFHGERRRFFGPTMIDAAILGAAPSHPVSLRVGKEADVRIVMADGAQRSLHPGDAIESLDAGQIRCVEVRG